MSVQARTVVNPRVRSFLTRVRQHKLHLVMILPVLAQFIIFKYLPLYGVTLAFKDYHILEGISSSPWVGLFNFQRLFSSLDFLRVFKNTIVLALLNFIFGFPAPIILALMINELRGKVFKRVTQTISYLPHFVSWVILAGIFMEVLSPSRGPINAVIKALGFSPIFFLGNPDWFRPTLVVTNIWKGLGWGSIVYLAALGGINEELYDAARVDGCNEYGIFFRIILPLMKPSFAAMGIFVGMNSWNAFLWPMIVLKSSEKLTLPIGLNALITPYGNNYDLLIAGAVFSVIPIIILFLMFQKYFIAGMTAGGVKG